MVKENILSYALTGASYIISCLETHLLKKITSVILFGSVAMGTADKESDVDLFFDADLPKKVELSIRAQLNKAADEFSISNTGLLFKSKSIDNEFSIKVGKLGEWEDLSKSISSNGIVLYSRYSKPPSKIKPYTILSWEKPGKAKGALSNKIYGYKAGGKKYPGLLEKFKGTKVGQATIMVPGSARDPFIDAFEKYTVNYSRYDLWG